MFRRMLPFVLAAVVLSVVVSVLFATMRMGKDETDLPVEPETPEPGKEG